MAAPSVSGFGGYQFSVLYIVQYMVLRTWIAWVVVGRRRWDRSRGSHMGSRWETGGWVRVAKSATLIGIGVQKSLVTTRLQLTWQLIQAPGSPVGDTSGLPLRYSFGRGWRAGAGTAVDVCLGSWAATHSRPSGMPEVGARTVASEFVSKQGGTEVRYVQYGVQPHVQIWVYGTWRVRDPRLSITQDQLLRRRNHRNLFQSRRCRGPCMAAWRGRRGAKRLPRDPSLIPPLPTSAGSFLESGG